MMVSNLIDKERGRWKYDLVHTLLTEEERRRVLSIPISIRDCDDGWIWFPSKTGEYTVREGYHFGSSYDHLSLSTNIPLGNGYKWNNIWGLKVPPKLCHFIWRLCSGSLPVRANLVKRHCGDNPDCSICEMEIEDERHALVDCDKAREVWAGDEMAMVLDTQEAGHFITSFFHAIAGLDKSKRNEFLATVWAAWMFRNKTIFDQDPPSSHVIRMGLIKMVYDYGDYRERTSTGIMRSGIQGGSCWSRPAHGTIKINTDASFFDNGDIGLGMVGRNAEGDVLFTASRRVHGGWSVEIAEFKALAFGMEVARDQSVLHAIFESDALLIIERIRQQPRTRTYMDACVTDIMDLKEAFMTCSFSHVKRSGNTVAHYVARLGESIELDLMYLNIIPSSILMLAEVDLI